jgi:NAD(P)-dependent dehydrogenase (short-subunit alcohol dehydrogenase family)
MNAPHPFKLTGLVALVTGGGRGLGLQIAKALADAGALVLVNGRSAEPLARAVEAIEAFGGRAQAAAFDVADTAAVKHSMAEIVSRHGRLDILVNNVGLRDRRDLFEFALDDVRTLLEVDLIAPFELSREAAKLMITAKSGRIINITSIAGPLAGPGDTPYTVVKGGLEALTRALAAELGVHGYYRQRDRTRVLCHRSKCQSGCTEAGRRLVATPYCARALGRAEGNSWSSGVPGVACFDLYHRSGHRGGRWLPLSFLTMAAGA